MTFKDLIEKVELEPYGKVYLDQGIFVVNHEKGELERFKTPFSASIEKRFNLLSEYVLFAGKHVLVINENDFDMSSKEWKLGNKTYYTFFLNELDAIRHQRSILMGIIDKLDNEIAALEYVDEGAFNPLMEYEEC